MAKAFDLSLVLYAEHELNASTFAARVTVSTLSDIYSGIVAAVGTLKGSLHGGANEEAWKIPYGMIPSVESRESAFLIRCHTGCGIIKAYPDMVGLSAWPLPWLL